MDEKLVKCGCGGEAKIDKHTYYRALPTYGVRCHRCGQQTRQFYMNEAEAITAWNWAMGTERCCNTCDSYEAGRYCLLWGIFCPSDHWCKDWSENE